MRKLLLTTSLFLFAVLNSYAQKPEPKVFFSDGFIVTVCDTSRDSVYVEVIMQQIDTLSDLSERIKKKEELYKIIKQKPTK